MPWTNKIKSLIGFASFRLIHKFQNNIKENVSFTVLYNEIISVHFR